MRQIEQPENPWQWISIGASADIARFRGRLVRSPIPRFTVWLCTAGGGDVHLLGQVAPLRPGAMLLLPSGVRAELRPGPRTPEIMQAAFDVRVRNRLLRDARVHVDAERLTLSVPGIPALSLIATTNTLSVGERLLRAMSFFADAESAYLELTFQIIRMIEAFRSAYTIQTQGNSRTINAAHRAAFLIYRRRDDPALSLAQIAEHVGLSRTHLVRLFRREFGTSPMKFLAQQRMAHARRLLPNSDFRITEISELCGYTSIQQFSRVFRIEHGVSPRDYRKRHQSSTPA